MKICKKLTAGALACLLTFGAFACGRTEDPVEPEIYKPYDYTATHESEAEVLGFYSSDDGLDSFLGDFFERHMRYTDNRIHTHPVGAGGSAWKEWESMIGSFWDASYNFNGTFPSFYATKDLVTNWLNTPKMDNQGYVWEDSGYALTDWGQGWTFPNYKSGDSKCVNYEFSPNEGTSGVAEGTGTTLRQSSELDDNARAQGALAAEGKNASEISFELVTRPPAAYAGAGNALQISAFHSPYLNINWAFQNEGEKNCVDDLYICFKTKADPSYSAGKSVRYSQICPTAVPLSDSVDLTHNYIPMYLNESWGTAERNQITGIKFVLKAKPGKTVSGSLLFDYIRAEYDSRQSDNVGAYITAAWNILSYAQDKDLIRTIVPQARKAMQHYLTHLNGADGLMDTYYYVGHDGLSSRKLGTGIANGYWDVLSFPSENIYNNLMFYRSVKAMLAMEQMVTAYGVVLPESRVKDRKMNADIVYSETIGSLTALEEKSRKAFSDTFWDEENGRFIGGWYGGKTGDRDEMMDNGLLLFNLEAIEAGLADAGQQEQIMTWLLGERTIAGDNSTGADIYKFEFAPRFNTKQNFSDYSFVYNSSEYETGVHNGGATLQTAYYDVVARAEARGGNAAYEQIKRLQGWYEKVQAAGGEGMDFYRKYYKSIHVGMQGGSTGGPVGVDFEFLEAALMFSSIPKAFFGLEGRADKTLCITPQMPDGLDFWKLENLTFGGHYYDVSIGKYFAQISNVRDPFSSDSENDFQIRISLRKPGFAFKVLFNGEETAFDEVDGRVVVTLPFADGKVEVVGV